MSKENIRKQQKGWEGRHGHTLFSVSYTIKVVLGSRLKPNHTNNHTKYKWSKHPLKGQDYQIGFL